jgi:hypothetical protein
MAAANYPSAERLIWLQLRTNARAAEFYCTRPREMLQLSHLGRGCETYRATLHSDRPINHTSDCCKPIIYGRSIATPSSHTFFLVFTSSSVCLAPTHNAHFPLPIYRPLSALLSNSKYNNIRYISKFATIVTKLKFLVWHNVWNIIGTFTKNKNKPLEFMLNVKSSMGHSH